MGRLKRTKGGFTLIEMMMVVGVAAFVMAAVGTGEARTLLRAEEGRGFRWVDWHPDGKRILTEEARGGRYETWLTNVLTGRRELVRKTSEPIYPAISPDGDRLAFLWNECHELRVGPADTAQVQLQRRRRFLHPSGDLGGQLLDSLRIGERGPDAADEYSPALPLDREACSPRSCCPVI